MALDQTTLENIHVATIDAPSLNNDVNGFEQLTVHKGKNEKGKFAYIVFDQDTVGETKLSMQAAFTSFCEASNVIAKNYDCPKMGAVKFNDPNAPAPMSDDWHDYEGADGLAETVTNSIATIATGEGDVRSGNITLGNALATAFDLLGGGNKSKAWTKFGSDLLDEKYTSALSEYTKLGRFPPALIDAMPTRYASAKGADKWRNETLGGIAGSIKEDITSEGKFDLKKIAANYLALCENALDNAEVFPERCALLKIHMPNIDAGGGFASCMSIEGEGDERKWVPQQSEQKGMKRASWPYNASALIANSQNASDELIAAVCRALNSIPSASQEAASEEKERVKESVRAVTAFNDLTALDAARHLFNIACNHPELGDVVQAFTTASENLSAGMSVEEILRGMLPAQADAKDADDIEDADEA